MKYSLTLSFLIIACSYLDAQNLTFSLKNEMKKDLMNRVNPSLNKNNPQMIVAPGYTPQKTKQEDNLLDLYKKYKSGSGGEEFDSRYKINPHVVTYSSETPINQIKPGTVVPVYTGGHFVLVNPATNALGLVKPSGMDLSGGGKKKMTKKTRQLLELLFDIKIEDPNQVE